MRQWSGSELTNRFGHPGSLQASAKNIIRDNLRREIGRVLPVNTPPGKKVYGGISFKSTNSGGGEQLLLLDCRVRFLLKGVFFHRLRYERRELARTIADLCFNVESHL